MKQKEPAKPAIFSSDADFIDSAIPWLASRIARLAAERTVADLARPESEPHSRAIGKVRPVALDEARRHLVELLDVEKRIDAEFTARLTAHRNTPDAVTLGIDRLVDEAGLNEAEELVLLATLIPALGQRLTEEVLGGLNLNFFGGSMTVESAVTLLDPQNVNDRLVARRYFRHDSRLVKFGLIAVEFPSRYANVEDFLQSYIRITPKAFSVLVGQPDLAEEIENADVVK